MKLDAPDIAASAAIEELGDDLTYEVDEPHHDACSSCPRWEEDVAVDMENTVTEALAIPSRMR